MKLNNSFHIIFAFIVFACFSSCGRTQVKNDEIKTVQVTDMAGRTVEVPADIKSVVCADMTATYFMYSLAPGKIVARNTEASAAESSVIPRVFTDLPVVGIIFYGKSTFNMETVAGLHPDILLCPLFKHTTEEYIADYEEYGNRLGIPVVLVDLELEELPESYQFMGKLLDMNSTGEELSKYCQETLAWADSVRSNITDTVSVYIAEGVEGLNTIPAFSTHSEIIEVAGVKNCAQINESYGYKEMSISFEQVLNWDPDYILVSKRLSSDESSDLSLHLKTTKEWKTLRAVKEGNILEVPVAPYNWIGRPPGINRLIGIRWLASSLYPTIATLNIDEEIIRFYSMFYHVQLSEEEAGKLVE